MMDQRHIRICALLSIGSSLFDRTFWTPYTIYIGSGLGLVFPNSMLTRIGLLAMLLTRY